MNFPQAYWAEFTAVIAVIGALCLVLRDQKRRMAVNALLVALTIFVASFLYMAISGNKLARNNGAVAVAQGEMGLRVVAMTRAFQDDMLKRMSKNVGSGSQTQSKPAAPEKVEKEAYTTAENALRKAVEANPKSPLFKAKLAILLASSEQKSAHEADIATLLNDVAATPADDAAGAAAHNLGEALQKAYISRDIAPDQIDATNDTIKKALSAGWFRDNAIEGVLAASHDQKRLDSFRNEIHQRYIVTLLKFIALVVVALASAAIGIIGFFVQLALSERTPAKHPDEVGMNTPLKVVYGVFVGWFTLYILISLGCHWLLTKMPDLASQAVGLAASTALTYLVTNVSGPVMINYLAAKPAGEDFWKAMHIQLRTSSSGPFKIFASGYLGWCSAIPLVFGTALAAHAILHSQGSDNPIIGQIMQAATASSPGATLLFYLTLGVMAPFFEEILFRGFLYSNLKTRIGSRLAIIGSALVFAGVHFDGGGFFSLFAIGVVLAYVFERTRSLVPSMLCHGLWNSGTFTLALVLFGS